MCPSTSAGGSQAWRTAWLYWHKQGTAVVLEEPDPSLPSHLPPTSTPSPITSQIARRVCRDGEMNGRLSIIKMQNKTAPEP